MVCISVSRIRADGNSPSKKMIIILIQHRQILNKQIVQLQRLIKPDDKLTFTDMIFRLCIIIFFWKWEKDYARSSFPLFHSVFTFLLIYYHKNCIPVVPERIFSFKLHIGKGYIFSSHQKAFTFRSTVAYLYILHSSVISERWIVRPWSCQKG